MLQEALRSATRAPWLAAATAAASTGAAWASAELVWNHPWLLLFALSGVFVLAHLLTSARDAGVLHLLPKSVEWVLRANAFEVVREASSLFALQGCKWVRLFLLACVELDEDQRLLILSELDAGFREDVFQKPVLDFLPSLARTLLLGRSGHLDRALQSPRRQVVASPAAGAVSTPPPVTGLLELVRNVERASGGSKARGLSLSPSLQKVLSEKVTEITVKTVLQGSKHQLYQTKELIATAIKKPRDKAKISHRTNWLVSTVSAPLRMVLGAWQLAFTTARGIASIVGCPRREQVEDAPRDRADTLETQLTEETEETESKSDSDPQTDSLEEGAETAAPRQLRQRLPGRAKTTPPVPRIENLLKAL